MTNDELRMDSSFWVLFRDLKSEISDLKWPCALADACIVTFAMCASPRFEER